MNLDPRPLSPSTDGDGQHRGNQCRDRFSRRALFGVLPFCAVACLAAGGLGVESIFFENVPDRNESVFDLAIEDCGKPTNITYDKCVCIQRAAVARIFVVFTTLVVLFAVGFILWSRPVKKSASIQWRKDFPWITLVAILFLSTAFNFTIHLIFHDIPRAFEVLSFSIPISTFTLWLYEQIASTSRGLPRALDKQVRDENDTEEGVRDKREKEHRELFYKWIHDTSAQAREHPAFYLGAGGLYRHRVLPFLFAAIWSLYVIYAGTSYWVHGQFSIYVVQILFAAGLAVPFGLGNDAFADFQTRIADGYQQLIKHQHGVSFPEMKVTQVDPDNWSLEDPDNWSLRALFEVEKMLFLRKMSQSQENTRGHINMHPPDGQEEQEEDQAITPAEFTDWMSTLRNHRADWNCQRNELQVNVLGFEIWKVLIFEVAFFFIIRQQPC